MLLDLDDVDLTTSTSVLGSDGSPVDPRWPVSPEGRPVENFADVADLVDLCESDREVDGSFGRRSSGLATGAGSKSNAKIAGLPPELSSLGSRLTLGCVEGLGEGVSEDTRGSDKSRKGGSFHSKCGVESP